MSGGVDSSVTAALLQEQGYAVTGIFVRTWNDDDPECPAARDAADARMVADRLGIELRSFDFSTQYWKDVFERFLDEHRRGRTPNPDIWCNQYIKFHVLLDYAQKLGADALATGHYAANIFDSTMGKYQLCIPHDRAKDQTYFLYTLGQEQLRRVLFPLAGMFKSEVRAYAKDRGLITATKKDSTGICFIGERHYRTFLQQYLAPKEGEIRDIVSGRVIGTHQGVHFYTIGQRRDLHVGGVRGAVEAPWFVVRKDLDQNILWVGQDENLLLSSSLVAEDLHWVAGELTKEFSGLSARIRYRSEPVACEIASCEDGRMQINFSDPVRAITAGQSVVLYHGDCCLGGGIIGY